jgi:Cu+-exporting ATPase
MMHKELIVEGMSCAACSSAVERILNKQEAVNSAQVNLTTKKLNVTFDESQMDMDQIKGLIVKAGFEPVDIIKEKKVVIPVDGMT